MKCYEVSSPTNEQLNFNYSVIRTRRVVECAFGRIKAKFMIIQNSRLSNPEFAGDVFMVCAALHNYIERTQVPPPMNLVAHVPTTNPTRGGRPSGLVNQGAAGAMRAHLAKHVASKLNLRPVTYSPPPCG
jgi:hypothetical protein